MLVAAYLAIATIAVREVLSGGVSFGGLLGCSPSSPRPPSPRWGDGGVSDLFNFQNGQSGLPKAKPYDYSWTSEEWTADETPYVAVRKEVEAYVLGRRVSRTKTDLVERTRDVVQASRANPKNAVLLYRAAYYEWVLAGLDFSDESKAFLKTANVVMKSLPSPHSREFDRLRLLREGIFHKEFLDLEERLYKLDPNDREVALKLARTHTYLGGADRRRGVEIAMKLLKTGDPKAYPAIYFVYAEAHGVSDVAEPSAYHVEQAFWGLRQYLKAGPDWRPMAARARELLAGFEKYQRERGLPVPPETP